MLSHAAEEFGTVRFDFETGDLQEVARVRRRLPACSCDRAEFHNAAQPYTKQGRWFLSTLKQEGYRPNDSHTGMLESPVFELRAPEMTFLAGGGAHPDTYVALCTLDGREQFRAGGDNSEVMARRSWNAPGLVGQRCFLRIVDRNQGGWGHITFDDFSAQGVLDEAATAQRFAAIDLALIQGAIATALDASRLDSLKAAVGDLAARYGDSIRRETTIFREEEALADTLERLRTAPAGEETTSGRPGNCALPRTSSGAGRCWRIRFSVFTPCSS